MPAPVAHLIRTDHREMERLFAQLNEPANRALVAPTVVALLAAHSRAEESEVYPAVRDRASDKVAHSQEEHVEADQLAAKLVDSDLGETAFIDTLEKLVQAVKHHIEEEEETVLPVLEALSDDQQNSLGDAFVRVRAEYLCAGATTLTRAELEQQARNEGITGTSRMSRDELASEV